MSGDTLDSSLQQLNWLLLRNGTQDTAPKEKEDVRAKPMRSYSQLIREAIESSPSGKCTLSTIYDSIARRYPYYANCPTTTWKNSVRHNLSLNRQFKKLGKAAAGKGSYWTVAPPVTDGPETEEESDDPSPTKKDQRSISERPEDIPLNALPPQPRPPPVEILAPAPPPSYDDIDDIPYLPPTPYMAEGTAVPPCYGRDDWGQPVPSTSGLQLDPYALPSGLSLFDSHDLNSSFRAVYDQVFHNRQAADMREEEARIDWLKVGLETAGIDYRDSEEMANVRADAFIERLEDGVPSYSTPSPSDPDLLAFPSYTTFASSYRKRSSTDPNLNQFHYNSAKRAREPNNHQMVEEEEEDDFDWSKMV